MDNRDAEGLVVKSSAVSTLSALCSMFRMLAGLHTVVCVQTHLVGRGERRWLVKSWVVCCAKIHQRVLMMTPPPSQSTLYPRHIPDTGRRSGLWLVPGLLLCGCFRSASCVTLGIAPLKQLGQDPCPCAFYIVDMVPYTISKLSAKSQFCAIQTADNTDGKVRIEIILLLENNKMLPGKIKTEKK